jgi:hypothetical protein
MQTPHKQSLHPPYHLAPAALLAFPGLLFAAPPPVLPFILLLEKPVRSPLLIASPLLL